MNRPLNPICAAAAAPLLLAVASLATAQPASIKVGNEAKNTSGIVTDVVNGDTACYLTLKDAKGAEFTEMADFSFCEKPKTLLGKRVALTYKLAKVMSDECQGDMNCKKTKTVALVSALTVTGDAPPATKPVGGAGKGQTSFCAGVEDVVFACRTGAKLVSVCAAKELSRNRGSVQYRFGKPDSSDPLELMLPEDGPLAAKSATGENVPFAGGGGAWLRFKKGAYTYTVYTGIGKWGPKGETREKAGLQVMQGGKSVASLKCTGPVTSQLGPEWFEKTGVKANGQEFDFPD